jgi:hypothetical protein
MAGPLVYGELTFGPDATSQNSVAYIPDTILAQSKEFTIYVFFSAGSAAGKIQAQTAFVLSPQMKAEGHNIIVEPQSTATWASVGSTIDWAAASTWKYASITGVFSAFRLNIDTAVTTGTVRAFIVARPG